MSVKSKNHHQSTVKGSTMSFGSRQMASPPRLGFSDIEQEQRFWKQEYQAICSDFVKLKTERADQMGIATRVADNPKEWEVARLAIESEYERQKANLLEIQSKITAHLQSANLRVKQRNERNNPHMDPAEKMNWVNVIMAKLDDLNRKVDILLKDREAKK